jgi:dethiobiotin synthetase
MSRESSVVSRQSSVVGRHGFFVTGTDTGVGKTLVACALLHAFAARGFKVVGMKPVASGAERRGGELFSDDVEQLIAAGNVAAPRSHVNPYCFEPAIAPHLAAERAGARIEIDRVEKSWRELAARAQVVIVEGVGGFRVPLGADGDTADLAVRLALPVVLVVGMRLGCLNHALLTAEAIASRGLALAGWIANHIDPGMEAADDNAHALGRLIRAPMLARIAHAEAPRPASVAASLEIRGLA